jgi:hypothetical protein
MPTASFGSMDQQVDFNPFAVEPSGEEVVGEAAILGSLLVRPTPEAYDELQRAYDFFNREIFGGELPPCLITLQRETRSLGYFQETTFVRRTGETSDEIAMNPRYFATRSIRESLAQLVHDMVHLWQHHFGLMKSRKGYHNREWADQMERIGLMPSNTGQPGGKRVGDKMAHYIMADGTFDIAATKLLTEAFNLSWMDRHPMVMPQTRVTPAIAASAGMQLPSPAEVAEVEAAGKHVVTPLQPQIHAPRTDGSNRLKYRCPSCATQVWGKPNLKLLCGLDMCNRVSFEVARGGEAVKDPLPAVICEADTQ